MPYEDDLRAGHRTPVICEWTKRPAGDGRYWYVDEDSFETGPMLVQVTGTAVDVDGTVYSIERLRRDRSYYYGPVDVICPDIPSWLVEALEQDDDDYWRGNRDY